MSNPRYLWRRLTLEQRADLLKWRRRQQHPWHRPPHREGAMTRHHLTAACFEHRPIIARDIERMEAFCVELLDTLKQEGTRVHAWCVLPNHYHALINSTEVLRVLASLGRMHGRLAFKWNAEEGKRGRQVWCGVAERFMRNDSHFWATVNYVHHNPVRHGYVDRWQDWPFSSARDYLSSIGQNEAARIWREYPLRDYGKGWDDPGV